MQQHDRLTLADLNYAQSWRDLVRWRTAGTLVEEDDVLMGASCTSAASFNRAMRTGPAGQPSAPDVLARCQAYFSARERDFVIDAREHADRDLIDLAETRGLRSLREPLPVMVLDHTVDEPTLPPPLRLAAVTGADGLADFASVAAPSFAALGIPLEIMIDILATPERIAAPHVTVMVAYDGAAPVSVGLSMLSHGIAGLYWIGTLPDACRRGLADAITRRLGNLALARGAAFVVLQASAPGQPVYERIGYRTVTQYRRYLVRRDSV